MTIIGGRMKWWQRLAVTPVVLVVGGVGLAIIAMIFVSLTLLYLVYGDE